MLTAVVDERAPDHDLWQLVCQGSVPAFEVLVRRHQSLVCAVAYSACGDLALSEDVAQETFWIAWRQPASLEDPGRLRSWLCGIARNLGNNARRREPRTATAVVAELPTQRPGPAEEAVTREEQTLVWETLEQIPETYREPLVLFYREGQSVAEVAAALDLSEDAVKQRLSRGRGMLRDRVAEVVEGNLRRTRPGRAFTVAVMTGLTALSVGAKTAAASAGPAGAGAVMASAGAAGAVGGMLGSLFGLAGGWLGTWLPAQMAPTRGERDYLRRAGRRMFLVSLVFVILLPLPALAFIGHFPAAYFLIYFAAWFVLFGAYVAVASVHAARVVKRLREQGPGEPNDTQMRTSLVRMASRWRGRVYRSRASLLGLPLVDINVSDPMPQGGGERRVARGWVAVGDEARGVLLAIGSRARGFIAIGGRSLGVLSFGGVAAGVVAIGGLALGVLSLGGLGVGAFALGGLAIGWQACGGGAIAWDTACGGGAVAWHAAYGGGAVAHDYALGGGAWAAHANDAEARAVLLEHPLKQAVDWYTAHGKWVTGAFVALALMVSFGMMMAMYRRAGENEFG
jgi:RNA polymerase sigma factor (sigma-70 family)